MGARLGSTRIWSALAECGSLPQRTGVRPADWGPSPASDRRGAATPVFIPAGVPPGAHDDSISARFSLVAVDEALDRGSDVGEGAGGAGVQAGVAASAHRAPGAGGRVGAGAERGRFRQPAGQDVKRLIPHVAHLGGRKRARPHGPVRLDVQEPVPRRQPGTTAPARPPAARPEPARVGGTPSTRGAPRAPRSRCRRWRSSMISGRPNWAPSGRKASAGAPHRHDR